MGVGDAATRAHHCSKERRRIDLDMADYFID